MAESDRFYLGIGIEQRRCAACAACPTLPCATHRDYPPCSGAQDCPSALHEHGCFADLDGSACNDPDDHANHSREADTDQVDNPCPECGAADRDCECRRPGWVEQ